MSRTLWRTALLGTVLAALSTGCAEERDPINRVQANALAKSFFVGEVCWAPRMTPSSTRRPPSGPSRSSPTKKNFASEDLLGRGTLRVQPILLPALIREMAPLLRASFPKTCTLDFHLGESLPAIEADATQLRQVVLNLLANARQALPRGGKICLRAGSCTLRGEHAVFIEVEDTGGGVPVEIMRNIFNPFFSTHPKGTGLGLSISHRIVEQHQGEIEVVNGELGTCFTVRLPLKPPRVIVGAVKTAARWPESAAP